LLILTTSSPTEIYTLSLHDALPICPSAMTTASEPWTTSKRRWAMGVLWNLSKGGPCTFRELQERCEAISPSVLNSRLKELRETRSEEHTSELQSRVDLVCRLLLEKK